MEDIDRRICSFIRNSADAREILSQLSGINIDSGEIQWALMEILHTDEPTDLLEKDYTADGMVELLRTFDFRKYHPEILAEILMDESIVPEGTPRLLTEVTVKHKGERWIIHKNDADPFPSNPHGHSPDVGLKLDLSTGALYRKRECVGKITKKNLEVIKQKAEQRGCKALPALTLCEK